MLYENFVCLPQLFLTFLRKWINLGNQQRQFLENPWKCNEKMIPTKLYFAIYRISSVTQQIWKENFCYIGVFLFEYSIEMAY